MRPIALQFGILAAALLALVQLSKLSLFTQRMSTELWITVFALVFLWFGYFSHRWMHRSDKSPVTPSGNEQINNKNIDELNISKRELEVLVEIANGLSNQEIAHKFFISESTVKTHVSNLFSKLNAKRRTQAVRKAKTLGIIH